MFVTAMVAAAGSLLQKHSNMQHVLALFFRDDIFRWAQGLERERGAHAAQASGGMHWCWAAGCWLQAAGWGWAAGRGVGAAG
jgi:hypothetical protein